MRPGRIRENVHRAELGILAVPVREDAGIWGSSLIEAKLTTRSREHGPRNNPYALARDDRDDTALLRAGDRAPDATSLATVEGERRLFDLTRGGRFTLLNFGPAISAGALPSGLRILHVVAQPADPGDIADSEGHLANAYGAVERTCVLIRPDGYVALISDAGDVRVTSDYLAANS